MTGTRHSVTVRTDLPFGLAAVTCSCLTASFLIGVRRGILGVASAYAVAIAMVLCPTLAVPFHLVGPRVIDLLGVTWRPLLELMVTTGPAVHIAATWVNNRPQLTAMLPLRLPAPLTALYPRWLAVGGHRHESHSVVRVGAAR